MTFVARLMAVALMMCICAAWSDGHARSHSRGGTHLYVLLGLGNNSPGLAEFGYRMQRRGIPTTVANYSEEPALAQQAVADYRSGRVSSIKIVGHSLGGSAAASMAAELGQAGVPVQVVVTLDPTGGAGASSNVRRFANFVPRAGENHFTMIQARMPELNAYIGGR